MWGNQIGYPGNKILGQRQGGELVVDVEVFT